MSTLKNEIVAFTPGLKTNTITMKLTDYLILEKPLIGDFSDLIEEE